MYHQCVKLMVANGDLICSQAYLLSSFYCWAK